MTQQDALNLRQYRTLVGQARKQALRKLLESEGIPLNLDPHAVSISDKSRLADIAKAVGYRKPITSCFSIGTAFYVYLNRGVTA